MDNQNPSIDRVTSVLTSDSESMHTFDKSSTSMLTTGFGIRRLSSLQRALRANENERRRLREAKYKEEEVECVSLSFRSSSSGTQDSVTTKFIDTPIPHKSLSLEYLMGIGAIGAEEYGTPRKPKPTEVEPIMDEDENEEPLRGSLAMRKAQKYLRSHHIFELFQFLTAHLLSDLPENPIQFLLDLLDHCLVYRSGYGDPPLLYQKTHLEQLFYLMDRMRTGFIEPEQYKTGMATLGICLYDKNPPLTTEGLVAKDTFIEEAYDCLTDLFVDMIRKRHEEKCESVRSIVVPPPPPTEASWQCGE